ncbi:DinB family protein [Rugosimonospora acidiphila]|uniref:DinB family protein n=1 Tax=Rugosimonospora acidiphila TaxID=556531 RepID=A0ABP9RKB3_9ACTN
MSDLDEQHRPRPPTSADETDTLLGFLEYERATLAWKCSELDAAGLAARLGPSPMTLGGMLKHLARVEDYWFSYALHARETAAPWNTVDWKADPDRDWQSAAEDSPEQLFTFWREAADRSRALVAQALAAGDLGQRARRAWPDGQPPSLRWILVTVIDEYARHSGHADLIRESVDGSTGQ